MYFFCELPVYGLFFFLLSIGILYIFWILTLLNNTLQSFCQLIVFTASTAQRFYMFMC